jgi:hypothetical protein
MKKLHPSALQMKSERADNEHVRELLQIAPAEDDQLQRSSRNKSGFKGVGARGNKYHAQCSTPPCRCHNLGSFDTPEEAAQAHYRHFEETAHDDKAAPAASRKRRKLDEVDAAHNAFVLGEDSSGEMDVLITDDQRETDAQVEAAAVAARTAAFDGVTDPLAETAPSTEAASLYKAARKARHDKAAREKREDEKKVDSCVSIYDLKDLSKLSDLEVEEELQKFEDAVSNDIDRVKHTSEDKWDRGGTVCVNHVPLFAFGLIDDDKDAEPAIQKCSHNEKISANRPFSTDHVNKGYMVTWALQNRLRELYVTMYECVKVAKAGVGCPAGCQELVRRLVVFGLLI